MFESIKPDIREAETYNATSGTENSDSSISDVATGRKSETRTVNFEKKPLTVTWETLNDSDIMRMCKSYGEEFENSGGNPNSERVAEIFAGLREDLKEPENLAQIRKLVEGQSSIKVHVDAKTPPGYEGKGAEPERDEDGNVLG